MPVWEGMWIPNRKLRRNRVLYAVLLLLWILIPLTILVLFPGGFLITIVEIGIVTVLIAITIRSYLRMPEGIELDRDEMTVVLPHRKVGTPLEDVIDLKYDPKDGTLRLVLAGSIHSFGDLGLSIEGHEALITACKKEIRRAGKISSSRMRDTGSFK